MPDVTASYGTPLDFIALPIFSYIIDNHSDVITKKPLNAKKISFFSIGLIRNLFEIAF